MKYNSIIKMFLAAGILVGAAACDDKLDIPQKGVTSVDDFYKTDADCEEAVTAMYAQMKDLAQGQYSPTFVTNFLSDDCYAGSSARLASDDKESINEYRFDSANGVIKDLFQGLYTCINRCNLIINNFADASTPTQKRAVAEAKVFRAYCNFNLVTLFGPVPLVTEAVRDDYKSPNSSTAELWAQVEADLKEAISSGTLPVKNGIDDKTTGIRVTNDYAKSILGKAYVFQKKWAEAVGVLDEVIGSGRYGFLEDYGNYALAEYNNNREIIFSDSKAANASNEGTFTTILYGWSSSFLDGLGMGNELYFLGFNFCNPSQVIVNAFREMEGEDGYRFVQTMKSYPRMNEMGVRLKAGATNYGHCGYGYWKIRFSSKNIIPGGSFMNTNANDIVMRYGEVVLLDAEAHIMLNDGEGDTYINMIREKAHLPLLENATMDDLKKEKQLELCMEGCRYMDLVRWGDAATVLKDQWKQVPNFAGLDANGNYLLEYPVINQNTTYGFKAGKHELLPIPLAELNVNPNIEQNPGWN